MNSEPTESITRALRFEVTFPGWRTKDLLGGLVEDDPETLDGDVGSPRSKKRKKREGGLWHALWRAQDDLTIGMTRALLVLYTLREGLITWPVEAPRRPKKDAPTDPRKTPIRTLAYDLLAGKWQPTGIAVYDPEPDCQLGGQVLAEAASLVTTRLATDLLAVRRGQQQLPTFRRAPIPIPNQRYDVAENGDITLRVFGRGARFSHFTVRPRRLDPGQRAILRQLAERPDVQGSADRLAEGLHARGSARLIWAQPGSGSGKGGRRKGKWMLSISWSAPGIAPRPEGLVCGVHLGMSNLVSLAFADPAHRQSRHDGTITEGVVTGPNTVVHLDPRVHRAARRLDAERRQRQRGGKRRHGDKWARVIRTGIEQVACEVVRCAKANGASIVALEDLAHWSVNHALDEYPDGSNRDRAENRRWYFRWHQGALRAQIASVAEREGLVVLTASARHDSRTCAACGRIYAYAGVYRPRPKRQRFSPAQPMMTDPYGRVTWNRWRCECGSSIHADRNAARNVALRGCAVLAETGPKTPDE